MDDWQAWFDLAVEQHQAGNLELAEPLYRRVLNTQPAHVNAQYLLGTLLLQQGKPGESITILAPLAEQRADAADVHNNLGIAYNEQGHWQDAARCFRNALKARSNFSQAYFNLASLYEQHSMPADAEQCYREAIDINPHDAQTLFNLASLLKNQKRWEDAEDAYHKLLTLRAEDPDGLVNLGFVLVQQERLEDAIEVFQRILAKQPDYAEVHNNLSYVYERQGRLEEAVAAARKAIMLRPDYAEGYNNLGTALRSLDKLDQATEAFRKAVSLKPGFALAEFNLGTTRLLAGDFAQGWAGYEHRVQLAESGGRKLAAPRWNGEPLPGQTLLIYSDQGFGDALQFVRDLSRAKAQSQARIVFECQRELRGLFEHLEGVDELIATGDAIPEHAAQCALLSLPAIFHLQLEDIGPVTGYVQADPALRTKWREVLEREAPDALRVGIVWQGNPAQPRNVIRSCRAADFAPLADIPDVTLVSLQRGDDALRQLRDLPPNTVELGSRFADFADGAAAVCELDLVISVDTAMVHLAGALGCPVWTLLASAADWRWLRHRDDNPWYPTMRLFRQPTWGDWDGVFAQVLDELRAFRDRVFVGQAVPDGHSDQRPRSDASGTA